MTRTQLAIGLCALLLLAAAWAWLGSDGDDATTPAAARIAVQTAPVDHRDIDDIREFSGTLEANRTLTVAPKIAGRVADVAVDIGDTVRSGDTLIRLDDDEYRQAVNEARARQEVAEAQLKQARGEAATASRTLSRVRSLNARGIAATAELDGAQAEATTANAAVAVARASITEAKAQVATAQLRLGYTDIHADWTGDEAARVVGERMAEPGDTVAANTPLLRIVSVSPLTAIIQVPEQLFPKLSVGQSAQLRIAGAPDADFDARIARIAPVFDPDTRRARVELTVPNDDARLAPGMFVQVGLVARSLDGAPIVARSALVTRADDQGVFVVDAGPPQIARFVPVEVAFVAGDNAAIASPNDLSGSVIVLGQAQLENGMAIAPEPREAAARP